MKTQQIYEVLDVVTFKHFSAHNKEGGSLIVGGQFSEIPDTKIKAIVVEEWDDYESGQHMICTPVDAKGTAFLAEHECKDPFFFVSEFDVLGCRDALTHEKPKYMRVLRKQIEQMRNRSRRGLKACIRSSHT